MKIAAVILNFNSYEDTRQCVLGLKKQSGIDVEIIIVDNCSSNPNEIEKLIYPMKLPAYYYVQVATRGTMQETILE